MQNAKIIGEKIVTGQKSYDVSSVVGIVSTDVGTSVTLRSGESMLVGSDPVLIYTLNDLCPWAVRCGV